MGSNRAVMGCIFGKKMSIIFPSYLKFFHYTLLLLDTFSTVPPILSITGRALQLAWKEHVEWISSFKELFISCSLHLCCIITAKSYCIITSSLLLCICHFVIITAFSLPLVTPVLLFYYCIITTFQFSLLHHYCIITATSLLHQNTITTTETTSLLHHYFIITTSLLQLCCIIT